MLTVLSEKADQNMAHLNLLLECWQQTMRLPTYCQNGSDMSFVVQEPGQKCARAQVYV